jgi:hypothetical protein
VEIMSRPLEYDARVRVRSFSVFDDDFDFMLVDLCRDNPEEAERDKTAKSLVKKPWKTPLSFGRTFWGMSRGLFPKRLN